MFCKNCGNKLEENQKFCTNCGGKVEETTEVVEEKVVEPVNVSTQENIETPVTIESESANQVVTENVEVNNMNNNMNLNTSYNNPAPKKKSNLPFIIAFIVLGIVIIGLIIFIALTVIGDNSKDISEPKTPTTENNKVDNSDDDSDDSDDYDDSDVDTDDDDDISVEKITVGNYEYTKLSGFTYSEKSNMLYVTDENKSKIVVAMQVLAVSYSSIESSSEKIKQQFVSKGYTVNRVVNQTFGTHKFVAFDVTYSGKNIVLFYAGHDDSSTVCGSVQVSSSYTYTEALQDISRIIGASTKVSDSDSSDDTESFDLDISNIK